MVSSLQLTTRCRNPECLQLFHVVPSDDSLHMIVEQLLVDRAAYGSSFLLEFECPRCKYKFLKNTSSLTVCDCGEEFHESAD